MQVNQEMFNQEMANKKTVKVNVAHLASKMKSKKEIYNFVW